MSSSGGLAVLVLVLLLYEDTHAHACSFGRIECGWAIWAQDVVCPLGTFFVSYEGARRREWMTERHPPPTRDGTTIRVNQWRYGEPRVSNRLAMYLYLVTIMVGVVAV